MSAIDDKHAELGGNAGVLGAPVGAEFTAADGIGRARHYQKGSIYELPGVGAHEVHGAILQKWSALGLEAGPLGYPLTGETITPDGVGRFNHFQHGSIYWTPATGAHEVHDAIRDQWQVLGWEQGILGYPVTDETATPDGVGRYNHFTGQNGSIYWHPATGAQEVLGMIKQRWAELDWERGRLGYPTSGEMPTPHGFGRVSRFQGGEVYWDAGRGPYEVWPPPPPVACSGPLEGSWQVAPIDSMVVGVHAVLLRTGKILFWNYLDPPGEHEPSAPQPHGESAVVDLANGNRQRPQQAPGDPNLFCAGQSLLADGRVLVAGGEREQPHVDALHTFTPDGPSGGSWQRVGTLATGRWYPTCATMHDGRVLILGGKNWRAGGPAGNAHTYEIYDPNSGGLTPPQSAPVLAEANGFDTFPFVVVLPNGTLFMHAGARTRFLDLATMQHTATALDAAARPDRNGRTYGMEGTSVLLPLWPDSTPAYQARVMVIGGGGAPPVDMRTAATRSCEVLDLGATTPAWTLTPPMAQPRVMPDAVLLPDGTVFVAHGSSSGYADNGANPVYPAERYDPATNTWASACTMTVPRLYHATALLLPDGRVLTAGTDSQWNPDPFHHSELRMELYSPPYLFRGPRPVIDQAPSQAGWDAEIAVSVSGPAVAAACLIRCGSSTHSFNSDQRHVGVTIVSQVGGTVVLHTPPNGFVAPPGYYLLFVLTGADVPSVAATIRLGPV